MLDEGEWMYGCDEVRVLDEDEVNVSEWMYGGIVMR